MRIRCLYRFAITVLVLTSQVATAADLAVIDLHNRTADEVLPVLRPLVGPETALSGIDYKLLVRGSDADVARIREALAVLDRAPRQLLVSVRYGGQPESKSTDRGVAGTTTGGGVKIDVRAGTTVRTAADSSVSSIRVLEGNGARITTGQSIPIITAVLWPQSNHPVVGGVATDYRELTSGFTVLPRVNGERVMLEISTQQERAINSNSGSAAVQRASTTLSGRLGQWIDLGGVTTTSSEQRSSIGLSGGGNRTSTQSDTQSIAVKVEQVD